MLAVFYSYPLTNFAWNPCFIADVFYGRPLLMVMQQHQMKISQFAGNNKTILTIVNHCDSISLAKTGAVYTLVSRASKVPEQFDNPAKFV
jgi:hypothetical protein